jgi:PAS domain-containing protein
MEKELVQAKTQAENITSQLRAVIDNMASRIYACDSKGRIILANDHYLSDYAASEPFVFPQSFIDKADVFDLDGQLMPVSEWPLSRALRGERLEGLELRLRLKQSGQEFIMSYNISPVFYLEGKLIMAVLTSLDITESKRVEEVLHENEVHRKVAEVVVV